MAELIPCLFPDEALELPTMRQFTKEPDCVTMAYAVPVASNTLLKAVRAPDTTRLVFEAELVTKQFINVTLLTNGFVVFPVPASLMKRSVVVALLRSTDSTFPV